MRNTATRALLQQSLARPELRRVHHALSRGLVAAYTDSSSSSSSSRPSSSTLPPHRRPIPSLPRPFHTTTPAHRIRKDRKKQKEAAARADDADDAPDASGPKHPPPNPEEPLDFADVASRLARHDERYGDALKRMKSGGRFNADAIGALRVADPESRKGAPAAHHPLREVAQVVPRGGRTISILASEAAYVKPIMSAVQASADFNQQPQRDPDNELELLLRIEPETRDDLTRRARALCHEWRDRVRAVRQKRDKLHVTWRRDGAIGPDLKRTADKQLEKIVKARMAEIDDAEKEALKAAEGAAK
ncbi:ribosome recycling factor [Hypoxylon cercidicola]|nr:ribosome recycling factor [Hypoxylon cercidicola]